MILVFFVCSHVYLLNYRSELAQIDKIHSYPKKYFNASDGRVVFGAYFQHTFCLDLILLCNLLQCCGTRSVLNGSSLFSDVLRAYFSPLLYWSQGYKFGLSSVILGAEKQSFMSPQYWECINFIAACPAKLFLWSDFLASSNMV